MGRSIQDNRNIKTVETENLQIEGHLMKWNDVAIQLSNISMITAAKLPAPRFPAWTTLLVFSGVAAFVFSQDTYGPQRVPMMFGGVCLFAVGIMGIIRWLVDFLKTVGHKYLQILLNSGYVYALYIPDQEFLKKVLGVFENIFRDGGKAGNHVQINIDNSTITGAVTGINLTKVINTGGRYVRGPSKH